MKSALVIDDNCHGKEIIKAMFEQLVNKVVYDHIYYLKRYAEPKPCDIHASLLHDEPKHYKKNGRGKFKRRNKSA